ncbi:MAG TPA: ROK family protein [Bdellovibrionota bacterium]|jgi:glucokinase
MKQTRIGVDLGGTNVRAGLVKNGKVVRLDARPIHAEGSAEAVLANLYASIDAVIEKQAKGIGIGVPSLVQHKTGTLLDTTNIPSWKKVPLRKLLEKRYQLPVRVDNDANCFALGEQLFGAGKGCANFVGLVLGTGMGAGIVANGKLVTGTDGGAGEFGLVPYRDSILEHYSSGRFFRDRGHEGSELARAADEGDKEAQQLFREFGAHLGFAVKLILYALAPERIVLGGSVATSWKHFEAPLHEALKDFAYPSILSALDFRLARARQGAILGAAALLDHS